MSIDYFEDFYFDFLQLQYSFYKKVLTNPDKMVLKDIGIFSELVLGAGLMPIMLEVLIGMIPPSQLEKEVKGQALQYIYDMGICSFNKYAIPVYEKKIFPLPRAFTNTTMCQEVASNFSIMVHKYHRPGFSLDIPYHKTAEAKKYVAKQYEELFGWLCRNNNKTVDLDRLRECIRYSNQAIEYMKKGNELRRKKEALIYGGQMLKFTYIMSLLGLEKTVEVGKNYYQCCEQKIETNTFIESAKHRILWCNTGIMYDDDLFQYIEKELGAVIVFEELNSITWEQMDERNPFESFAERAFSVSFVGEVEKRIANLIQMVQEYSVDGVIFFKHQNCRLFNLPAKQITDTLHKKGIPVMELSGDSFDSKNYSKEQIMTRLEAFVEMLS